MEGLINSIRARAAGWAGHSPGPARLALTLRIGLGLVFIIGGTWKLSHLLNPGEADGIVTLYMSSKGYVNTFFAEYLFTGVLGQVLTPWIFLTMLSSFELVSGLALVAGFLVRPLAFVYALLLWSFVVALPVVTAPGFGEGAKTYQSPALFVQIRDIGLSGLMIVLYNLGSGLRSVDERFFDKSLWQPTAANGDVLALVTRLSLAAPLIVGGFFAGFPNIQSFGTAPLLLMAVGLALGFGIGVRAAAAVTLLIMVWFMLGKVNLEASLLANLNGFKREFAFAAGAFAAMAMGGGRLFVPSRMIKEARLFKRRELPEGARA